jgi:hypothetical protein
MIDMIAPRRDLQHLMTVIQVVVSIKTNAMIFQVKTAVASPERSA